MTDGRSPNEGSLPTDLESVRFPRLARVAVEAVDGLWDTRKNTFWRDTFQREKKGTPEHFYPTATFRCTEELLKAEKRVEQGFPPIARLRTMTDAVVGFDPETLDSESSLNYPPFTLALGVAVRARIAASGSSDSVKAAVSAVDELSRHLIETLPAAEHGTVHPFVRFHAIRALSAARGHSDDETSRRTLDGLFDTLRSDTSELLAKHHMGLISPAEHVVLAFCAAALATTASARDHKISLAALLAAVSAQDGTGSWPLGRVVREEPSRLEISTYEVAWAVASTLRRLLKLGLCDVGTPELDELTGAVARAGTFAERSIVELAGPGPFRGWASDHPYERPRIESWTSAVVLQFALEGDDLRYEVLNRRVLRTFNVLHPSDAAWPAWLEWESLKDKADPAPEASIYEYLERNVITPIKSSSRQLPSGSDECASVLLFGPPGTSKTTLVKAVAQALGWPVVQLSPGTFIEKGLEAIEAEAQSVFGRLLQLRQAVVMFDECDELFRDRDPEGQTERLRNISAFVTASMLPKLQELHDSGQVLFFICTNHVARIDPAVLRGGRIDHRVGVGPPGEEAREFVLAELGNPPVTVPHAREALDALGKHAHRFSRPELKRAGRMLVGTGFGWAKAGDAHDAAIELIKKMSASLTITERLYNEFEENRSQYCDVYTEKDVSQ